MAIAVVPMRAWARSFAAAARMLSLATLMPTRSRFAASDKDRSIGCGQACCGWAWYERKNVSIASTASALATAPALCPPIPSATTNSRPSMKLPNASSFSLRWRPGCETAQETSGRAVGSPFRGGAVIETCTFANSAPPDQALFRGEGRVGPKYPLSGLRPTDGIGPAGEQVGAGFGGHGRVEDSHAGGLAPLVDRGQADAEGGQLGGAQRGRLDHLGAEDLRVQEIGLRLHQQIVGGGAPVDAETIEGAPGVGLHGGDQVDVLQRDRFQRGARDVGAGRPARDSADEPPRLRAPVRRAQTGQRRDDRDAARIGDRPRERLDLGGARDDTEAVAQPLHQRAGDE